MVGVQVNCPLTGFERHPIRAGIQEIRQQQDRPGPVALRANRYKGVPTVAVLIGADVRRAAP